MIFIENMQKQKKNWRNELRVIIIKKSLIIALEKGAIKKEMRDDNQGFSEYYFSKTIKEKR